MSTSPPQRTRGEFLKATAQAAAALAVSSGVALVRYACDRGLRYVDTAAIKKLKVE